MPGFVRSLKGIGIRVKQADFEDSFQKIRPHEKVPPSLSAKFTYKLQPLPAGVSPELVEEFTKKNNWVTRAIRAIGRDSWLVASAVECPKMWMGLNGTVVLVKPMQSGDKQTKPIVLAGSIAQYSKGLQQDKSKHDPWTLQSNDPWAKYQPHGANSAFVKPVVHHGTSGIAPNDPSIAKKMSDQDKQIASLQQSVKELTVMQQKRSYPIKKPRLNWTQKSIDSKRR